MATKGATKNQVLWRGFAAILGVFAGLCTIFALAVTAAEAWQEHAQAQWLETTARLTGATCTRPAPAGGTDTISIAA